MSAIFAFAFLILIIIILLFFITLGIDNGYIAVGTCKCGGKYRYFFHDSKWGKNVYICDKCKKRIM
jgi:hypothetical protein